MGLSEKAHDPPLAGYLMTWETVCLMKDAEFKMSECSC